MATSKIITDPDIITKTHEIPVMIKHEDEYICATYEVEAESSWEALDIAEQQAVQDFEDPDQFFTLYMVPEDLLEQVQGG